MKRAALVSLGLLTALLVGPAQAATTYIAVEDLGAGVTPINILCSDVTTFVTTNRTSHVAGPETPPSRTGSLRIDPLTGYYSGIQFAGSSPATLGTASTFTVSAYPATGLDKPIYGYVRIAVPGDAWVGLASTTAQERDAWSDPLDLGVLTYHWVKDSNTAITEDQTVTAQLAEHGGTSYQAAVLVSGCSAPEPYYLDKLSGFDLFGGATTWDYERVYETSATITTSAMTTVAGRAVTLRTEVSSTGLLVNGRTMKLQAKAYGAAGFSTVGTHPSSFTGNAFKAHKPRRATTYRWRFDGTKFYAPVTSAQLVVQVRAKVTTAAKDKTLSQGQRVVLTGKTTPRKKGVAIKLWRKTASGKTLLSTGKTRSDGSYRITKKLAKKGSYKVYVEVAAGSGNLAGTSPRVNVKVT